MRTVKYINKKYMKGNELNVDVKNNKTINVEEKCFNANTLAKNAKLKLFFMKNAFNNSNDFLKPLNEEESNTKEKNSDILEYL